MTEKRFTFEYDDGQWGVPLFYDDGKKLCFDDVVVLLNEQQATINEHKEAIEYLKTVIRYTIPNQMVADVFKKIGEEYE